MCSTGCLPNAFRRTLIIHENIQFSGLVPELGSSRWETPVGNIGIPLNILGDHLIYREGATFNSLNIYTGKKEWRFELDSVPSTGWMKALSS